MAKYGIIIDSLAGGGAEKVMLRLSEAFLSKKDEVVFFLRKNKIEHEIPDGIKIICLEDYKNNKKMKRKDYAKLLLTLIDKEEKPFDILLSNLESTDKISKLLNLSNMYFIIHNTISKKLENRYSKKGLINKIKKYREILKFKRLYNSENLITVSDGVKDDILNILKIKPKTIQTIYNPFDFDLIREKGLEGLDIKINEPYIIHVGRFLIEHKRQDLLLEAYKKSNIDEKLLIVGQGEDKERIEILVKKLALEDKVILVDFQKNPYPLIKNAKLFVLSSDYEGLPTVLIESLILGTPVLSTNCKSGPEEMLSQHFRKHLSPVGDSEGLSENIKKFVNSNIQILESDIQRFETEQILKQYKALVKTIL